MTAETKTSPKHACQLCGSELKLVETIINDEFYWNEVDQMYQRDKSTDMFEHIGKQRCSECKEDWTGL